MTEKPAAVVAMIMAMDRNRLIGKSGGLPWHIPGELAYFKSRTLGKPVIMGRRTFESIGKALPDRTNIVVTANRQWQAPGTIICHSLDEALSKARHIAGTEQQRADEVMIIGGARLCEAAMPETERLYLTLVEQDFEGDTWLDSFHWHDWVEVSRQTPEPQQTGGIPVSFLVLEKKPAGFPDGFKDAES